MRFSNVLVTGGAGFVGSQLVKKLLPITDRIYVIDNLTVGKQSAIPDSEKIVFMKSCVSDEQTLSRVLPDVEWIFHLACRGLTLSTSNVHEDFLTNFNAGYELLRKTKELCPGLKRLVYTSTASIYGNSPKRPTQEEYYNITTPYSASKFAMEQYCTIYEHLFSLPITTLRLSNVYGPGQVSTNPYCGVVAKFMEAILQNKPLPIFGDGIQTRDFTFIDDVLAALLAVTRQEQTIGKIYNIGTEKETSVNQLAHVVKKITGHTNDPVEYLPKRVIDHIVHRSVSIERIRQDVGWQPSHTLEEGLRKTYEWYLRTYTHQEEIDAP